MSSVLPHVQHLRKSGIFGTFLYIHVHVIKLIIILCQYNRGSYEFVIKIINSAIYIKLHKRCVQDTLDIQFVLHA